MAQADRRGLKVSLKEIPKAIGRRRGLSKAWVLLLPVLGLPVLGWSIPWGETRGGRGGEGTQGDLQWSIEQVLRSPFPGEMVADRAGQRLAWVFNAEGKRNIWLADEGGSKTRQLTRFDSDSGQEISSIQFSHDGAWIVFVRGGSENSVREIPNPTSDPAGAVQAILAVEVATGRIVALGRGDSPLVSPVNRQVVYQRNGVLWLGEIPVDGAARRNEPETPLFLARGQIESPQWSPGGERLAFVSQRRTHSLIGIYDAVGRRVEYLEPSVDRDSLPRWSADGRRLAFLRQSARESTGRAGDSDGTEPWSIMVQEVGGEKRGQAARQVWRSGIEPTDAMPLIAGENRLHWAADDQLVFASEMDGWLHLYSIGAIGANADGEVAQPRLLTPGACEFEEMAWTPDRREIVFSSNCGDPHRRHLWRVAVGQGEPRALTQGTGLEWRPVVLANGRELAWLSSTDREPAAIRWQRGDGTVVRVAAETHPADFPAPSSLVTPEAVSFTAGDGMTVHGQLFLPAKKSPSERLPAVLFMHGGPNRQMMLGWHNRGYYHHAYGFNQYLASQGYAVLSVNYRLGTGYGRAFRMARNGGGRGAAEYQDILAAAHWLRARPEIDAARIGLWGGSYGGFLVALGLARNSDLFAAGVDLHGVHDWFSRLAGSGDREAVRIARESSPLAAVETWRSPVLLIHGDDDRNVAFSQTVDLVRRLRAVGVPHELKVYTDEVHDFLLHRHWVETFRAAADFFERELKRAGERRETRPRPIDLLIRNGEIHDGMGGAPYRGEVAIAGDRIVYVGPPTPPTGVAGRWEPVREIDAQGMVVAPGFIDPHTHTAEDLSSAARRGNIPYLTQGVTTVLTGNDGSSPFPIGETLTRWQSEGIGTNAALFIGHGTARLRVMGMRDTAPTESQLRAMQELIRQAMREGAIGMSTGLYYAPGNFAKTEEVIALARVVAGFGGVYDTHMRDESTYSIGVMAAIEESIRIGREARLPIHLSHLKMLGVDVWGRTGEAIQLIERARAAGVDVTANQYPYTASGTSLTAALVPRWAEAGGMAEFWKRVEDPTVRPRLAGEMEVNLQRRGGPASLLLTSGRDQKIVGQTLEQLARQRGRAPIDVALDIIRDGGAGVASFNMNEQDIEQLMKQPWMMTGSDGSAGHPRKYGTYPRKIRDYVLNRRVISLPRMIEASSRQVAQSLRLPERGTLAAGYYADVIVFDPATIAERATYQDPTVVSVGMRYVVVNGRLALEDGQPTGILAGRALKK